MTQCKHKWEPAGKREIRGAKVPMEVCRKCGATRPLTDGLESRGGKDV